MPWVSDSEVVDGSLEEFSLGIEGVVRAVGKACGLQNMGVYSDNDLLSDTRVRRRARLTSSLLRHLVDIAKPRTAMMGSI